MPNESTKEQHIHTWSATLRWRCKCGASHVDKLCVGIDGALFIDKAVCERAKARAKRSKQS